MLNSELERFWSKVDRRSDNECWPWTDSLARGYGAMWVGSAGRIIGAHRIAYTVSAGTIPEGSVIDHQCHNESDCDLADECPHRACCNPAHLRPMTIGDNVRAGKPGRKDNEHESSKTHCPHGHEYSRENTRMVKGRYGKLARQCRACDRNRKRGARLRLFAEDVTTRG